MTERGKTIGLAVSITLNVVLICAIVAGLYMARQAWRDRMDRRGPPLFETARTLPKADQDRLRGQMRDAARASKPEFHEARELRRKAARLAAAPTYDRAAVLAALRAANAAEMRGRDRLDERLSAVFEGLSPQARKTLAPGFEHRSRGLRGRPGDGGDRGHRNEDKHDKAPATPAQPATLPDTAPAAAPAT